ncbi:MAG: hypothetical protein HY805_10380 [Nitrospirae bacterium]|nr:hypothetical protein [Nitrospirota bacterium]
MAPLSFNYIFKFIDGSTKSFEILLDPKTLLLIAPENLVPPEWARLTFNQCHNCPLNKSEHEFCPIAVNIASLVSVFSDRTSYENVHVLVMTKQRDISKTTTMEDALSSLLGIYMVTSGCPRMEKLKPLVRYHLPFATIHETVVRIVSMYLLIQYFLKRKGKKPDWDLKELEAIYDEVMKVNAGIAQRLKSAAEKDASITAVANLNYLASLVPLLITDTLDEIEDSLSSYLTG